MTIRKTRTLAVLASAAILTPMIAVAAVSVGDTLSADDTEIRAKLEAAGYTVKEIEREDGEIEVEAILDGRAVEIEIAPETGMIVEIEADDDDEDDCDDDKGTGKG